MNEGENQRRRGSTGSAGSTGSGGRAGPANAGVTADAGDTARSPRPFAVTHGEVWQITLPMTLAYLTTPLIGLTDTAIVGRTGDAVALGGLAVGALIFDFAFATFNFLRMGTTGLTAQAYGRDDRAEIEAVIWRAGLLALAIGLALLVAEPLVTWLGLLAVGPDPAVAEAVRTYVGIRMVAAPAALLNYAILGHVIGKGRAGLGLALQIVVNGANIALSLILGLWLGWGIAGVALGTVLGEAIGALAGLVVVARGVDPQARPGRARILDRRGFTRMVAVNRDIMIRSFCLLSSFLLFSRLGAQAGALMLAANGLLMNFFAVSGFFLDGMATASEQLVGRAVGARYRPAFERAKRLTILWGFVMAAVLSAAFWLGGEALIAALTTEPDVRGEAGAFLVYAALTPLAGALAFVMDGIFIGATWSRAMRDMMVLSLLAFAALAYGLVPILGNDGLWIAFLAFLGLRGVFLLAIAPRRAAAAFAGSAPRN